MTSVALSNPAPTVPDGPIAPGELMRLTGERLAAGGIPVRLADDCFLIAPAARPRSKKQAREACAARCALSVYDDADARLCFFPWAAETADGHWLADIAAALLTGTADTGPRHPDATCPAVIGVKGTVGMDLRHRGFGVRLNTYEDDHYYSVGSDISVTAPGADGPEPPVKGVVYVADDGTVCWERGYWHEYSITEYKPHFRSWLPDPSAVALAIAETVSAAIRTAWPELGAG